MLIMSALVFYANRYGMILYMKKFIWTRPFAEVGDCLGRTFSDIISNKIGEQFNSALRLAVDGGPSDEAYTFEYKLLDTEYYVRTTYLQQDMALVVVQF